MDVIQLCSFIVWGSHMEYFNSPPYQTYGLLVLKIL